jgi:hypothetical protein
LGYCNVFGHLAPVHAATLEIYQLDEEYSALLLGGGPESIRAFVRRMPLEEQGVQDMLIAAQLADPDAPDLWERLRRQEEEHKRRSAESKQRDRELLERNRASVGLPPLTPEELEKWGLKDTEPFPSNHVADLRSSAHPPNDVFFSAGTALNFEYATTCTNFPKHYTSVLPLD